MAKPTRALSASAANNCETAKNPQCRCRCGGRLHGAGRGKISGLPLDDPHSPSVECPRCKGTGKLVETDWFAKPNEDGSYPTKERTCVQCKGAKRIIKPAVLRALQKIEGEL